MADPLTTLGLASNISDLISKGHEISKSVDGTLVENLELETSLQELSSGLTLPTSVVGFPWFLIKIT